MGKVLVEVELENYIDRIRAELRGRNGSRGRVRRQRIRVLADSGATAMVLPQDLVKELGLPLREDTVIVTYADDRKEERPVAWGLRVRVGKREMEVDCIVGPPGSQPLLGQIVLERLDLLVDCARGRLTPRPESPYLPTLDLR